MTRVPPPSPAARAVVTARGRDRVRAGHPWVFAQDVEEAPPLDVRQGGPATVWVTDRQGTPLAVATYAAGARLPLRVLERTPPDASKALGHTPPPPFGPWVEEKLRAAWQRRQVLGLDRDAFRVCHGEGDGLPGLFVDLYADAAVIQTSSVAMDNLRPELLPVVQGLTGATRVIAREDSSMRDFEGLPRFARVEVGQDGGSQVVYRLGPNLLEADLLTDGKTGGFLDQADNHAFVAALTPPGGRCLDAFSYHGGFALALARRGGEVLATDESPAAVERTQANAQRNGLTHLEARQANAFDLLRACEADAASRGDASRFDVVVLDPPAFAKRRGSGGDRKDHRDLTAADRAYREIFLRGFRITRTGGLMVACSCSGQVSRGHFEDLVTKAAGDAGRMVQVLARRGPSADHPELLGVSETGHLKVWVLRVIG